MAWIPSDLKATLESVFSIGSAAISGARDLIFRNTAGTIRIRGTPTGDHVITAPAATGTMVVSGQDATLNSLTVDTANVTIEAKEQDSNAGLTVAHDATGVAFIDLKRLGGAQGSSFGLRVSLENDTFAALQGGSGVILGIGPAIRTWQGNPLAQELVGIASTFTTLRYSTGDWVGTRIPTWDIQRTGASVSNLSFFRYDDTGVTPTEHLRLTRSSGLTTLFGDVTLSASTMPQLSLSGTTRSVIFQPTGNNLGIEYRNAISGGIIYTDWSADAGSDFHLRFSLNSATDARVVGASGLTWRLQLPVSLESTVVLPTASIAAAGQLRRNGDLLEYGNSSGTAVTILNSAGNLSNVADPITARSNLRLGINAQSLSGPLTLTSSSAAIQLLNPNGAARDVNLPTGASHLFYQIENTAATSTTFGLVVKNAGGSTLYTILPQTRVGFYWNGSSWEVQTTVESNPTGITGASTVTNIVSLTQSQYDALGTYNASTLYHITNSVTDVLLPANNLSDVGSAVTSRANLLLGVGAQSLAGPLTLTASSATHQLLNPNGANRNVDLPTGATGLYYRIQNTASAGTAFNLVVRNSGGSTLATITPQATVMFLWDGSTWQIQAISGGASIATNRETLAATKTLTSSDANHQFLNPNGADRNVDLPTGFANGFFVFKNIAAAGNAFSLIIRNPAATTLFTVPAQYTVSLVWDGTEWQVM